MLQVRVLTNRKFLIATIIVMLVQGALLAGGILIPILLQSYMGFSATTSGLVLLPGAIVMGAMGPVAGRLFDKHGPRVLAVIGTGVLALTTATFMFMGPGMGLITLTVIYTVRLFSLSLVNMPISTWGMNALPDKLMNHGTSVQNTFRQVAGSLGTAVIVSASTVATNMVSGSTDAVTAGVFGIHAAFAVATALCVLGFVLTVALVRNKPGDEAAADEDNAHRSIIEQIMKRDVYTLPENATVLEAMQLLVNNHISAAPLGRCRRQADRIHLRRRHHALPVQARPDDHGPRGDDRANRGRVFRPQGLRPQAGAPYGHESLRHRREGDHRRQRARRPCPKSAACSARTT